MAELLAFMYQTKRNLSAKSMGKFKYTFSPTFALMWAETMNTNEFKFYCSHCDQPLQCEAQFAGRQIQCPACQHLIRIPNPPAGMGFTQVQPESGQTWATHVPKGTKG
jgi:DNA-directed RNA polymerase subunit RPC12/RpoP